MESTFSKTQIDKLGERLRAGTSSEEDLQLLDRYRRTFGEPYEQVVKTIRDRLGFEPTGRPAKSTSSIREKLLRESIRLSQIQDIAGCRIIVDDIAAQNFAVERIMSANEQASKVDRRLHPSHGYRAVHVIVRYQGKLIEVQCRTELQHLWSQLSERLSDTVDPALKYGGGPSEQRAFLDNASRLIADSERAETSPDELVRGNAGAIRKALRKVLQESIQEVPNSTGG